MMCDEKDDHNHFVQHKMQTKEGYWTVSRSPTASLVEEDSCDSSSSANGTEDCFSYDGSQLVGNGTVDEMLSFWTKQDIDYLMNETELFDASGKEKKP